MKRLLVLGFIGLLWLPARAQDLCKGMEDEDLKVCSQNCTTLPASRECLFALRFGAAGFIALNQSKKTGMDPEKTGLAAEMSPDDARALRLYLDFLGAIPIHPFRLTGKARQKYKETKKLTNKGSELYREGRYDDALRYFNQALEIDKAVLGPRHPDTATDLNNIGMVYQAMGRYEEALRYMKQALEIDKSVLGPRHPHTATTLNNIGQVYQAMGRYEDALRYFNQALAIDKSVLGPRHPDTARDINNIGMVYARMGRYEAALMYLKQALEIWKTTLGPWHIDVAGGLSNIAILYWKQGHIKAAKAAMTRAIAIVRNHFYENTLYSTRPKPLLWASKVLNGLRRYYDKYINLFLDSPRDLMDQALVWQGAATTVAKTAFDMQRVRREMRDRHDQAGFELLKVFLEKRMEYMRLKMVAPTGKGKVLEENIRERDRALKVLKKDLKDLETKLAQHSQEFKKRRTLYMAGRKQACEVLQDAGAALVVYVKYQVYDPKAETGKRWKGWRYLALVMVPGTKGCQVRKVGIGDADKVNEVVKTYVKEMKRQVPMVARNLHLAVVGKEMLDKKGRKLAQIVLDPVMKIMPKGLGMFVTPDGALNEVNLGALPVNDHDLYLIEQRPVAYLSNPFQVLEMKFLWPKKAQNVGKGAFVGWAPDFDRSVCGVKEWVNHPDRCLKLTVDMQKAQTRQVLIESTDKGEGSVAPTTMAGGGVCAYDVTRWHPLSGWETVAKGIVKSLVKILGKQGMLYATGKALAEEVLRPFMEGKKVVVLFTHGFFVDTKRCPQAVLARNKEMLGIGGFGRKAQGPAVDPFRLSGLVLAGANQGAKVVAGIKDYLEKQKYLPHDGLVTGRDIIEYDMRSTRLVVLDACDTAQGVRANGQPPLSIAHAFDVAGVRLTTTPLWDTFPGVASTMIKALVATMDQASDQNEYRRALTWYQRAMKIVLKKYGLPVFWAAFTPLVGG